MAVYGYIKWNYDYWKKLNIPGPEPRVPMGTMMDIKGTPIHLKDLIYMKKYGKICGLFSGRTPYPLISDVELIKKILVKDFDHFIDRPTFDFSKLNATLNEVMTNLRGETWRSVRNHVSPVFTSGKLKQMFPLVKKCLVNLMENLDKAGSNKQPLNMTKTISAFSVDVILSSAFSVEVNSQKEVDNAFVQHAFKLTGIDGGFTILLLRAFPFVLKFIKLPIFPAESMNFFHHAVLKIIDMRKSTKSVREDLLQILATENRPENVTERMLVAQCLQILLAGHDTTATSLTYVLYSLALYPECQKKLHDEVDKYFAGKDEITYELVFDMPYLDMVVSESSRMYPIAVRLERACIKDITYDNLKIKKGMVIGIPAYGIHHTDEFYPNPEKFDPERFSGNKTIKNSYSYLTFGQGPRNCIGMRFALMEIKFALVCILQKFRITVSKDTEVPLTLISGRGLLKPKNDIILAVERR